MITCYNHAHYLPEAIESALSQQYKAVELIVVDDGSTDNSYEVARSYTGVTVIRQENLGLAAARNTGLEASRAEYVTYLDADDRLLPDAIEIGVRCLHAHPACAMVYGRCRIISHSGDVIKEIIRPPVVGDHYAALLEANVIGMHAVVMYRRQLLIAAGRFNVACHASEDYEAYLRIARTFPITSHSKVIAEYRWHDHNMSRDAGRMMKSTLAVLRLQQKHVLGRPALEEAYKAGIAATKAYYGQKLLIQAGRSLLALKPGAAVRGLRIPEGTGTLSIVREVVSAEGRMLLKFWPRAKGKMDLIWRRWSRPFRPDPMFGNLRRLQPVSPYFGFERGKPLDRFYIERYLERNAACIHGRVLEIGDDTYTRQFGAGRVDHVDVLHVHSGNPAATIVGDLATADHIPSNTFDCVLLIQTLHLIYDFDAAIQTVHRILKPGGVLLATFPGVSSISRDEWKNSWLWSFTSVSAHRMFAEVFTGTHVEVGADGNVLAAMAFLQGLSCGELTQEELDHRDPQYEVIVHVKAVKG